PITKEQWLCATESAQRLLENSNLRLTRNNRKPPHREVNSRNQCAVTRCSSACRRQRPVCVRGHPRDTAAVTLQRVGSFGKLPPSEVLRKPLDDRRWPIISRLGDLKSCVRELNLETLTTDNKHERPCRNHAREQSHSRL